MKSMHKVIRSFALLLITAPSVLFAQKAPEQLPCPNKIQEQVVVALARLEGLKSLESLQDFQPLAQLHTLSELSDFPGISYIEGHVQTSQADTQEADATFDAEKTKSFDKTYKVGKNDVLAIENKFGKVHVNTWNKNEIRVKVDIIGRASSESKAQEILDNINIADSKSGNRLSVKTEMGKMNNSGNSKKSFEINYTIYMPDDNEIAIKNSFGDVYLPDFKGKTDLDIRYGSLKAQRMTNAGNIVKLAFSNGNCSHINKGDITISYSDFNLGSANGVQGSSKFSEFKIGELADVLELDLKYGSLRVDNISKGMQRIELSSGFSPVSLNFDDNTAFNFDVNVQFGDFNVNKNLVNITSLEKSHTSAEYKGKFGTAAPTGSVNIRSKYGDVKFTK